MCDFPKLNRKMFEALADIEAGRFVFVVARKHSNGLDAAIEDVIIGEVLNPRLVLERHCKANGKDLDERLCLPVILPPGLHADEVHGFRPVRTEKALWIEYTREGPIYLDRASED